MQPFLSKYNLILQNGFNPELQVISRSGNNLVLREGPRAAAPVAHPVHEAVKVQHHFGAPYPLQIMEVPGPEYVLIREMLSGE